MSKEFQREDVDVRGRPWKPEIVEATMTYKGTTIEGKFGQTVILPQNIPADGYFFDSNDKIFYAAKINISYPFEDAWEQNRHTRIPLNEIEFRDKNTGEIIDWWEDWKIYNDLVYKL